MIYYASAAIVMLGLLIGFYYFLRDLSYIWRDFDEVQRSGEDHDE